MFRKNLLISAIILGFSGGSFAASTLSDSQITKMNLSELRSALDKKDITSEQIVSAYMAAINKDDRQGKKIKALITLNGL